MTNYSDYKTRPWWIKRIDHTKKVRMIVMTYIVLNIFAIAFLAWVIAVWLER